MKGVRISLSYRNQSIDLIDTSVIKELKTVQKHTGTPPMSMMKILCKNNYQLLAVNCFSNKNSIIDVWQGPKYTASDLLLSVFEETEN